MSQCVDPQLNVPGPQGPTGNSGTNGINGINALSLIDGGATVVPAFGASVVVPLRDPGSKWMGIDQIVFISSFGYYKVLAIPDDLHAQLQNLGYTGNVNGNGILTFADLSRVSPGGLEGAAGSAPAGVLLAANNLSDLVDASIARTSLGLGALAVLGNVDNTNWNGAGVQLSIANGGTGAANAAGARTNLGLGTMAVQNANAVAVTGGTVAGTPISGSTGSFTTLAASGATTLSTLFTPTSALQTLAAGNTILPNAGKVRVVGSGGPITLISTPTITNPAADGQLLLIVGTHAVNTLTVQDNGTLAGSNLKLGAVSRALGLGSILLLSWDSTTSLWLEIAFRS